VLSVLMLEERPDMARLIDHLNERLGEPGG
jgi:hypothetical protein